MEKRHNDSHPGKTNSNLGTSSLQNKRVITGSSNCQQQTSLGQETVTKCQHKLIKKTHPANIYEMCHNLVGCFLSPLSWLFTFCISFCLISASVCPIRQSQPLANKQYLREQGLAHGYSPEKEETQEIQNLQPNISNPESSYGLLLAASLHGTPAFQVITVLWQQMEVGQARLQELAPFQLLNPFTTQPCVYSVLSYIPFPHSLRLPPELSKAAHQSIPPLSLLLITGGFFLKAKKGPVLGNVSRRRSTRAFSHRLYRTTSQTMSQKSEETQVSLRILVSSYFFLNQEVFCLLHSPTTLASLMSLLELQTLTLPDFLNHNQLLPDLQAQVI